MRISWSIPESDSFEFQGIIESAIEKYARKGFGSVKFRSSYFATFPKQEVDKTLDKFRHEGYGVEAYRNWSESESASFTEISWHKEFYGIQWKSEFQEIIELQIKDSKENDFQETHFFKIMVDSYPDRDVDDAFANLGSQGYKFSYVTDKSDDEGIQYLVISWDNY